MSKLVIISGPLGSGKSTLAKLYAQSHPMTLNVEIDDIKRSLGDYRSDNKKAQLIATDLSLALVHSYLSRNGDVVLPHGMHSVSLLERFLDVAMNCKSELVYILLKPSLEDSINNYEKRGLSQGYPGGYDPKSNIAISGGPLKLEELYNRIIATGMTVNDRITMNPEGQTVEQTYEELSNLIDMSSM
jgi:energy-coupling factor transporter ATP-binding protein EcfA2